MQELLEGISSAELSEWQAYYVWRQEQEEAEREFRTEVAKAERWVKGG